jgi:hypothetical protein
MGFREPDSTVTVRFEDGHRYHGLEATLRSMTIDEYAVAMGWDGNGGDTDGATLERFFKALVSWNLTDSQDLPIPVSEAHSRDKRLILALNSAWIQALVGVHSSDPLPESSTSGSTSEVLEIPMAPLSESRAS